MFTGEEPLGYQAQTSTQDHDGRFNEVEENISWLMRFPSGALATGASSYGADLSGYVRIHGAHGWLQMTSLGYEDQHLTARYARATSNASKCDGHRSSFHRQKQLAGTHTRSPGQRGRVAKQKRQRSEVN